MSHQSEPASPPSIGHPVRIFLCYSREKNAQFADRVYQLLSQSVGDPKSPELEVYINSSDPGLGAWQSRVEDQLDPTDLMVLVVTGKLGGGQTNELGSFKAKCRNKGRSADEAILVGFIADAEHAHLEDTECQSLRQEPIQDLSYASAVEFTRTVLEAVGIRPRFGTARPAAGWRDYEKVVIDLALGEDSATKQKPGVPSADSETSPDHLTWPEVERFFGAATGYPQFLNGETIGGTRPDDARILVDGRSRYHTQWCGSGNGVGRCLMRDNLTFAEAGPRETLRYPTTWRDGVNQLRVGIVVSGGIAPGINAVISGIIQRHLLYHAPRPDQLIAPNDPGPRHLLDICGYPNGFTNFPAAHVRTFYNGVPANQPGIDRALNEARRSAGDPGSRLGTSRLDSMLGNNDPDARMQTINNLVNRLRNDQIDILYVIGGDGSMRAAHAIWEAAQRIGYRISVVGIPKTMDNDILWVWQSFGFLSAAEKAREALQQLHVEVCSNPRVCVCQLFGSDSGFVVSHAALASGVCDLALIPEVDFTMPVITQYLLNKLIGRVQDGGSPYALVAMAETAIPLDAANYIADPKVGLSDDERKAVREYIAAGRRVVGQTNDDLQTAGLRIVAKVLESAIHQVNGFEEFRVLTNEPRHLLRTVGPSVSDVIFGQRLGTLAVDNAMAGYTDFMISQWMTEFVLVPLPLVIMGRKRVPKAGIFWKSVVAATGQPASLVP